MYSIKQLKKRNEIKPLEAICREFSNIANKTLDWKHWSNSVGALVNNNIADCLVLVSEKEIVGVLAWSYFPDLISAELSATEILWYVKPDHRGNGVNMLDKMIEICKGRDVINVNMAHFYEHDRVGKLYERKGFARHEVSYVMRLN